MGEWGYFVPIKAWLTDPVVDPDLKGLVAKARAELRGYSEEDVRGIWKKLEEVLTQGQQELEKPLPTYTPELTVIGDPSAVNAELTDKPIPTVDLAAVLWELTRQKYPPLKRLVVELVVERDGSVVIAFAKLFAILILHECAIRRPEGAIRAAWEFDRIYPALRALLGEGYKVAQSRKTGAKEGVKARKKKANALHAKMIERAKELRADGRDDHELAGRISREVNRTPNTVRRVLQRHGILKKRT